MRAFLFLFLVGCGGRTAVDAADAGDASIHDAGAVILDAGADVDLHDPIVCSGGKTFAYDKSCTGGCAIATVYLGCCESDAVGINAGDLVRFLDASAHCGDLDPCDCAGNSIVADDGNRSKDPAHRDIDVRCDQGVCKSFIR